MDTRPFSPASDLLSRPLMPRYASLTLSPLANSFHKHGTHAHPLLSTPRTEASSEFIVVINTQHFA